MAPQGPWRRALLILLVTAAPFLSDTVICQDTLRSPGLVVKFESPLRGAAEKISGVFPDLHQQCATRLGFDLEQDVTIHVVRNEQEFNSRIALLGGARQPDHVLAVAFSRLSIIVIHASAWQRQRHDSLEEILLHELAHVFLGQVQPSSGGSRIPRWFDEGVAQWVTRRAFLGDDKILKEAMRGDALIDFDDLERSFPREKGESALAYAQSLSFIRFISNWNVQQGEDVRRNIPAVLRFMRGGESFQGALKIVTGLRVGELAAVWRGSVSGQGRLSIRDFPAFLLSGLLIVCAILLWARMRVRRARRLALLDQEEECEPGSIREQE